MSDLIELFLPIPGYEGRYSVSNLGTVISHNYNKTGSVVAMKGLTSKWGYKQVKLSTKGKREYPLVHRLVMLVFVGPCPDGMEVNHKSGVKSDNRLSNLEYSTRSKNMQHAFDNKLVIPRYGERHRNAKLSVALIKEARAKLASGMTQKAVAKLYGVSPPLISKIFHGKAWVKAMTGEGKNA